MHVRQSACSVPKASGAPQTTHPSSSEAPPASFHSGTHAAVADLDGGRVRDLKVLGVVLERGVGLSLDVPGGGSGSVLRPVNHLT